MIADSAIHEQSMYTYCLNTTVCAVLYVTLSNWEIIDSRITIVYRIPGNVRGRKCSRIYEFRENILPQKFPGVR